MFKGLNKLELNKSTMMAAIEEYLNDRITSPADKVEVTGVTQPGNLDSNFAVFFKPKVEAAKV